VDKLHQMLVMDDPKRYERVRHYIFSDWLFSFLLSEGMICNSFGHGLISIPSIVENDNLVWRKIMYGLFNMSVALH
jgi:hypothetical protein